MDQITAERGGDKWTQSDFREILEVATERGLVKVGAHLEGLAVELAPVATGRLRGSIVYATKFDKSKWRSPAENKDIISGPKDDRTLHVGTAVKYAEYQEYGTRKMPAQSYLRPAMDLSKDIAQKLFSAEIKKTIKEYGK